jgi:hypothetical protein
MDRDNYKTHIYFNPSYGLDNLQYVGENEKKKTIEYVNNITRKITSDNIFDVVYKPFDVIYKSGQDDDGDDDDGEYPYENATEIIIDKTQDLCKGTLNSDFISESFESAHAVVIISDSLNISNGTIFGFALINFNKSYNSVSIEVICSNKGVGKNLIEIIEHICKKLSMSIIYLVSVKSAIPFYKKMGFVKYKESCDDMCTMIKIMRNGGKKGKTNKQKYQNQNKKTRKNGKCRRGGNEK